MRLLLISGEEHGIVASCADRRSDIVNAEPLDLGSATLYWKDVRPSVDAVLITGGAFTMRDGPDREALAALLGSLDALIRSGGTVVLLAAEAVAHAHASYVERCCPEARLLICESLRYPLPLLESAYRTMADAIGRGRPAARSVSPRDADVPERDELGKKRSIFDRFRLKPKQEDAAAATDALARRFEGISRGINRVIAVTGHRGSGLTSTAVNIAYESSRRGLRTLLVDLDIDYRSVNMYLNGFHEMTKRDEEMNASLLRTLARPQDYLTTAYHQSDSLWTTSLGYGFGDHKLIERVYTGGKLIGMLSVMRNHFNVVVVDFPMDRMREFKEALLHIDAFALCVSNNLPSVISALRNAEVALDRESAAYVNSKSRVVVTKYNDRSRFRGEPLTPGKVVDLMASGLSDCFPYEMKVAGHIPYSSDFDGQVESDRPIASTSPEHEKAVGHILLRLIEGAM
ncbi:hypothetical protein MO973_10255 [Paenibacillus sp. TRM 82003]|nr:hypothetical protein [Paenibacillus sp. TRM 82003]